MENNIDNVIRDVAQYLGISRSKAAQLCEDAQIALENACDTRAELKSITIQQVKRLAIDMGRA
jgi:hypothetical protein